MMYAQQIILHNPKLTGTVLSLAMFALTLPTQVGAVVPLGDTVDLYGFIKLDATYQSDSMNSDTAPRFVTGDGDGTVNFTPMHSRFGLKWTSPIEFNGWKTNAQLELDLFDPSRNQMKVRVRHANFNLTKDSSSWLFGQYWDVFSPLGPTTFMTNGYLWQTGNIGFRRAQIRYSYKSDIFNVQVSVNDPVNSTSQAGVGNKSDTPLIEGRLGFTFGQGGKTKLGVSVASGEDQDSSGADHDVTGVSIDAIIPITGGLSIKGEVASGENLQVFLSRAGQEQDVTSGWVELVYKSSEYGAWLGYAAESIDSDDLAAATDREDTTAILLGFSKNLSKNVSMGVELSRFESDLRSGTSFDGDQVIFSASHKI